MNWEEIHTPQNMTLIGEYIWSLLKDSEQWEAVYDWRENAVRTKNVEEYAKLLSAAREWHKATEM